MRPILNSRRFYRPQNVRGILLAALAMAILLGQASPARANIPEPDNLVFGMITPSAYYARNRAIMAEVRDAAGALIGSFAPAKSGGQEVSYVIPVPLDAWAPASRPEALLRDAPLMVFLKIDGQVADQRSARAGGRGALIELNFAGVDSDDNGLPDAWELDHFGHIGVDPAADPDGDGWSNLEEFQRGTNPLAKDARHPADLKPADQKIGLVEITDYALAWKTGQPWPQAPTSIPIDYLTRAAALWKGGELYRLDPAAAAGPPMWWVNSSPPIALAFKPSAAPRVSHSASDGGDEEPAAPGSAMHSWVRLAADPDVFLVTVQVQPGATVNAWAVEESIPGGWMPSAISGGGSYVETEKKVKWGPYYDSAPRGLTYRLERGSESEASQPSGTASFDGFNVEITGSWEGGLEEPSGAIQIRLALTGGSVRLEIQGPAQTRCQVETASHLGVWSLAGQVQTDHSGAATFTDAAAGAVRFYRVRLE